MPKFNPKRPKFFAGKTIGDDLFSNSVKLSFPELPIVFHTIGVDDYRWNPKKHKPIVVDAWVWALRNAKHGWVVYVQNGIYTNKTLPHCYDSNSCLNPSKMAGDISRVTWPMNTEEDYERAKNRIIQVLGGINLGSLLVHYPPDWGFDPSLVLPKKLWDPANELWNLNDYDYLSYSVEWNVPMVEVSGGGKEEAEDDF
jgi:hypothetical protein